MDTPPADQFSYFLLVAFGMFAVGIHAYTLFGQQIPGFDKTQTNPLLDSVSVVTLGGQYSFFRGFVFYLFISELMYLVLASSSVILALSLKTIGREDMVGALSDATELNPLIPILASSVIVAASQVKPLSEFEHAIRRIAHRIAGIPRNVFEVQEKIKSITLDDLRQHGAATLTGQHHRPVRTGHSQEGRLPLMQLARASEALAHTAANAVRSLRRNAPADASAAVAPSVTAIRNVVYLQRLLSSMPVGSAGVQTQHEAAQQEALAFSDDLHTLLKRSKAPGGESPAAEWQALLMHSHEVETLLARVLCLSILDARKDNALAQAARLDSAVEALRVRCAPLMAARERTATESFDKPAVNHAFHTIALLQYTFRCQRDHRVWPEFASDIAQCEQVLIAQIAAFETLVDEMVNRSVAEPDAAAVELDRDWGRLVAMLDSLRLDLVSAASILLDHRLQISRRLQSGPLSRIADYAEEKAGKAIDTVSKLELSRFEIDAFRSSLEKVFCLYEWTLGIDGDQIWSSQDTRQIIGVFDPIRHKFGAFESELSSLVEDIENVGDRSVDSRAKINRWKKLIAECSALETELAILLSLLLINKPDVRLKNYNLLQSMRNHALERNINNEINTFGLSALFGALASVFLITAYFYLGIEFKSALTFSDIAATAPESQSLMGAMTDDLARHLALTRETWGMLEAQVLQTMSALGRQFETAFLDMLDYLIVFVVSTGIAISVRAMRRNEKRWPELKPGEAPPLYAYVFVGTLSYLVSTGLILLYRLIRLVILPILDSDSKLLTSTHLSYFRDNYAEYMLVPLTAFVCVWFALKSLDARQAGLSVTRYLSAFRYALLCTLINMLVKTSVGNYSTGWEVADFIFSPLLGYFGFFACFMYVTDRYLGALPAAAVPDRAPGFPALFRLRSNRPRRWSQLIDRVVHPGAARQKKTEVADV